MIKHVPNGPDRFQTSILNVPYFSTDRQKQYKYKRYMFGYKLKLRYTLTGKEFNNASYMNRFTTIFKRIVRATIILPSRNYKIVITSRWAFTDSFLRNSTTLSQLHRLHKVKR